MTVLSVMQGPRILRLLNQIICYAPNVHLLTAVVTCRRQVCHDPAGILLERVERLSKHQHSVSRY